MMTPASGALSKSEIANTSGLPVSELAKIELDRTHVDMQTLEPTPVLISRIAELINRRGTLEAPGYAFIPDARSLLESRDRVVNFQINLMLQLKSHFELHTPEAVKAQHYLDHPDAEQFYATDSLGIEAFQFSAYDGKAVQSFHFDNLRQSYVALVYGPNYNISGGTPRLFDALKMVVDHGLRDVSDIVQLNRLAFLYTEIHTGFDLEGAIRPEFEELAQQYVITFDQLDSEQLPLMIFSNRLENGIMHGATPPRTADTSRPADRPISYVAIKHLPFIKSEPFGATHKLLV